MFFKKVLTIGLMAVALMSYSIAALAENKKAEKGSEIFTSALQTPPPGYVLEKSFGNFTVIKDYEGVMSLNKDDVIKTTAKATEEAIKIVKERGGNAILAEKIDVVIAIGGTLWAVVILQGEAVALSPAKQ